MPADVARQYEVFPLELNGTEIDLALGNPVDQDAFDNLSHLLGKTINSGDLPSSNIKNSFNAMML